MIVIRWHETELVGYKAVRGSNDVTIYDENFHEINHIYNIYGKEWNYISIEGEWSYPEDIPTEMESLHADIDFLTMENEFLESENAELRAQGEIDRADIDYCLMLLEE